jgi:hypothetical protein
MDTEALEEQAEAVKTGETSADIKDPDEVIDDADVDAGAGPEGEGDDVAGDGAEMFDTDRSGGD